MNLFGTKKRPDVPEIDVRGDKATLQALPVDVEFEPIDALPPSTAPQKAPRPKEVELPQLTYA